LDCGAPPKNSIAPQIQEAAQKNAVKKALFPFVPEPDLRSFD
jgi:hypothetical protein